MDALRLRRPAAAPLETIDKDEQVWVRLRMRGWHTGAFVMFKDGAVDQVLPHTGREIDFE
ncbi:hypothetical protein ACWDU8_07550 [Streptomyces sp. NPDC003388]